LEPFSNTTQNVKRVSMLYINYVIHQIHFKVGNLYVISERVTYSSALPLSRSFPPSAVKRQSTLKWRQSSEYSTVSTCIRLKHRAVLPPNMLWYRVTHHRVVPWMEMRVKTLSGNSYYVPLFDILLTSNLRTLAFRRVLIVEKGVCYFHRVRLSNLSVCPHISQRLPLDGFPWNFTLKTFIEIRPEFGNLIEIGQKCRDTLDERLNTVLLLPATLTRLKIILFEWNGIRLLRKARRYTPYASALQCPLHLFLCVRYVILLRSCYRLGVWNLHPLDFITYDKNRNYNKVSDTGVPMSSRSRREIIYLDPARFNQSVFLSPESQ
jgi:hypothetical protein